MACKKRKFHRLLGAVMYCGLMFSSLAVSAECKYQVLNDWSSGFTAAITITNDSAESLWTWSVQWQYSDGSTVGNGWNAAISGSNPYTASAMPWNGYLAPGASVEFGFQGVNGSAHAQTPVLTGSICSNGFSSSSDSASSISSQSSVSSVSSASESSSSESSAGACSKTCDWYGKMYAICPGSGWRWVDGAVCVGEQTCAMVDGVTDSCSSSSSSFSSESSVSSASSVSSESSVSSLQSSSSSSVSSVSSSSSLPQVERLDNPWQGASLYVNPKWSTLAAAEPGGEAVAQSNTAIWLENADDIAGLEWHLNEALKQQADLVSIVINGLPNRDCAGVEGPSPNPYQGAPDIATYKTEFIDAITRVLARPEYASLRVAAVLEVHGFASLTVGSVNPDCALSVRYYQEGLRYALNAVGPLANVYVYIDIAHAAWLGWQDNFDHMAVIAARLIESTDYGWNGITGFATNVGNYVPLQEPFMPDVNLLIQGLPLRSSDFYEWNRYFGELPYAQAWRERMLTLGAPDSIGMLIDTSRNGWGGQERPTAVSEATDVNTYVDESRLDRRSLRYLWCNQVAGLGARTQVAPAEGVDAYAWIKVPGESDGDANYTRECESVPVATAGRDGTDAMEGAPARREWFPEAFQVLLKNAYPALPQPVEHVDNPWLDAKYYVDPEWSSLAAAEPGGAAVAGRHTAVWLESNASVNTVRNHLDNALAQGATLVSFVVNKISLPECSGWGYNLWLETQPDLMQTDIYTEYKTQFIDPLAAAFADPAYAKLRIAVVLEVNAIAELITNRNLPECQEMYGPGGYRDGMIYALNTFAEIPNVYSYVDIAYSGWLGWADNFAIAIELTSKMIAQTTHGWDSVAGFASNTAQYVPLEEPFLPDTNLLIGGQSVRSADFYEWNLYFDELDFARDWRLAMIAEGAPESIGMIIDTSRNGWGGPNRPTGPGSSFDVSTYVDQSRLDRRSNRMNWCNVASGLGVEPQAAPYEGIDAFTWIKAPGISDGSEQLESRWCNPNDNYDIYNDAMPGGPKHGQWFPENFRTLLERAYPPL